MKFRRNDPCWCGSGKKYKKCHLGRESMEPLPVSQGLASLKAFRKNSVCQCPPSWRADCQGKPIKSHSISKALGIREMSDDGHVLGLKHDFSVLAKNNGSPEIGEIGLNQISIFPGFCRKHDKELFSPIEDQIFSATPEQCCLIAYRAIARELHTKVAGSSVNENLKQADQGRPLSQQFGIQSFLNTYGGGLGAAKNDLEQAISTFHDAIETGEFDRFSHLVIEFTEEIPLLCTTGHLPHESWDGKLIQNLSDFSTLAEWVTAASFRSNGKSYAMLSCDASHQKAQAFVVSLMTGFRTNLADAIVKYFFTISENLAIKPSWWNDLSIGKKIALESRILDGNPFLPNDNIIHPKNREPIVLISKDENVSWVNWPHQ